MTKITKQETQRKSVRLTNALLQHFIVQRCANAGRVVTVVDALDGEHASPEVRSVDCWTQRR